ncbi:MAG: hypothetical protein Q4F47_04715 [Bacteroidaceae bacterium]|nr:hypothetical protein [Bacteroidaceae bacterium]MDO5482323.1 hypothetical protein [Bacteroidaceae bacterium]
MQTSIIRLRQRNKRTDKKNLRDIVLQAQFSFGYESRKLSCSDYSATAESATQESAAQESAQTESQTTTVSATIESVATVSAAGAALPQDTNDTDAVRAIAATAAKTNFFIIFFYFNLLNNQYAFKTLAKLQTFRVSCFKKLFFFYFLTKKSGFQDKKSGFLYNFND